MVLRKGAKSDSGISVLGKCAWRGNELSKRIKIYKRFLWNAKSFGSIWRQLGNMRKELFWHGKREVPFEGVIWGRKASMIHLIWNCRGLGLDMAVPALHGLIRKHRPTMIFLSDTKMKDNRIDGIRKRMGYSHGFHVSLVGRAGGLSLWL